MEGIIVITVTSFILSVILSFAYQYLNKNEQDIKDVESMLPGYNCNVCGFGVCKGMAEKAFVDSDKLVKCKFLKEDKIKEITEYIKKKRI